MTDRFDSAFDPPDPSSLGTPAVQSVQASLYLRLKKSRGNKAGDIGWLLVRAAQPEHPRHMPAIAALSSLGVAGVRALAVTARATRDAPKIAGRPECLALARAVVGALEGIEACIGEDDVPVALAMYLAARGDR